METCITGTWKEPEAWKKLCSEYPQLAIHPQTNQLRCLMTTLSSGKVAPSEWIHMAERVNRLIVEFALNFLPVEETTVTSPVDDEPVTGVKFSKTGLVGVSVIRAGESMEAALRSCARNCRIGKILIQRDPTTHEPVFYLAKLPHDIATRHVLLLDPMLATGGSALVAIEKLLAAGAKEENIVFVNVVAAPEGIRRLLTKHPKIRFCTTKVAVGLNDNSYIRMSVGDWGDRFYGTGNYWQ